MPASVESSIKIVVYLRTQQRKYILLFRFHDIQPSVALKTLKIVYNLYHRVASALISPKLHEDFKI